MAIKTARQAFTKDEVIDILKRNVTLYKNEPEFVEYIVNLALYLIDQAYCLAGERSSDLESVIERYERSMREPAAVPVGAKARVLDVVETTQKPVSPTPPSEDSSSGPSTNKLRLKNFEPLMKNPPPPEGLEEELDPTTAQLRAMQEQGKVPTPAPSPESAPKRHVEAGGEDLGEPKTRQLRSPAALTPPPIEERRVEPSQKIQVESEGRARVYRVVRSYSAKDGDKACPICGTDTKGQQRCPSCGHIM